MSKSKNKNHSEVEYLRGIIKRLKSELKYYKRRDHFNDRVEDVDEPSSEYKCTQCGKGELDVKDFKFVVMEICNNCGYRKRLK